jgi:outer membrane protein TolC
MRAAVLFIALASCVPSSQELRAPVDRLVRERLGAPIAADTAGLTAGQAALQIDALLARPLDAPTAIRIALATSPRVRAALDELDIAAGDVAAALGLGPVAIDAQLRFAGSHREYELDAIQSVLGLVAAPGRRAAARAELAAARATAAATALRLAARVEIAFDDLLAAQQEVELRRTALDAADAGATVRERMHAAGNASDLAVARDRDAREQARVELGRAEAVVQARREGITALLGLSGARTAWTAAGALRDVPPAPPALDALEATAVAASLELAAGRERRDAAEHRAAGERLRAVLPELGVGVAVADDGAGAGIGPALRIGIPLLDPRTGERARANALVRREDHALAAEAIELRAAARAARFAALATYQEARQLHDVVLPLRRQIVDETLKHYNAMDADPFALIVARRELVDGAHQYLDALRRHWNAIAETTALSRGVMLEPPPRTPTEDRL